jgi:hypothetical protein
MERKRRVEGTELLKYRSVAAPLKVSGMAFGLHHLPVLGGAL